MTIAIVPETTTNLAAVARKALEAAGGDPRQAARIMQEMVLNDPGLAREMLEGVVSAGCWRCVRQVMHQQRTAAWTWATARQDRVVTDNGLALLATANAMSLLDYPLSDGTLLGDATAELLRHDAALLLHQAATMAHRARWLTAIADRLPPDAVVRQAFTNEALAVLREETANA